MLISLQAGGYLRFMGMPRKKRAIQEKPKGKYHEDTDEIEISPFKTRAKLVTCEDCGARIVSAPVAERVMHSDRIDWDAFRRRAKLCPECRRKSAASAAAAPATNAKQEE